MKIENSTLTNNFFKNNINTNFNNFNLMPFYYETPLNLKLKNHTFYVNFFKFNLFSSKNLFIFNNIFFIKNSFYNSFIYLRKSSFINFFIENMIDIPVCFKKTKSLKFKNFELPILKFINLLMRQGKKEKMNHIVFFSFFSFFSFLKKNFFLNQFFLKIDLKVI